MTIPASLRRQVVDRAGGRCEYCGLSQAGQEARFHVDHVTPVAASGSTALENLALARVSCSLRKGAREETVDPATGKLVRLFHPRRDAWLVHFAWDGLHVTGLTPVGRATIAALRMNRPLALAIREEETHRHRHPPPAQ
ncbi:MAG: restriction endonuclease [Limisphaerales bacterium]|nr:MAG: restriction endonuclease [Limisphaerales bacterium]KAG0508964.1 MAG: restriction endonuclease [Limisphaerales bacterium]TXT51315.1 MAG: restriction endonuclease [Limisphaerales bacterium]